MTAEVPFLHSSALRLLPPSLSLSLQRYWTLSFSDKAPCMISSCRPLVWPQLGLLTKAKVATRAMKFSSSIKYFFKKYFRTENYSLSRLFSFKKNPTLICELCFIWIADLKIKLPKSLKIFYRKDKSSSYHAQKRSKQALFRKKVVFRLKEENPEYANMRGLTY